MLSVPRRLSHRCSMQPLLGREDPGTFEIKVLFSSHVSPSPSVAVKKVNSARHSCLRKIFESTSLNLGPWGVCTLPPGSYPCKWALVNCKIVLYSFRSSVVTSPLLTLLRVNSYHSPRVHLKCFPFIEISLVSSTDNGESPIIYLPSSSLRILCCLLRNLPL